MFGGGEKMKNFLIDFLIKLGASVFYGILISIILVGGSINGHPIKGILGILKEWFR